MASTVPLFMIPIPQLLLFASAALVMVLTPGPNMLYLISRSLCQGPRAACFSLVGVGLGFVLHLLLAAFGLTAFFTAVPAAYSLLKYAGALYLVYLAYSAVKPGARGPFAVRDLPDDGPVRLVTGGFLTNALNPKIAIFYVSIFSQFLDPNRGSILLQSVELGLTQITISMAVNYLIIQSSRGLAGWLQAKPTWARAQRWVLASVLGGFAARLALSDRK